MKIKDDKQFCLSYRSFSRGKCFLSRTEFNQNGKMTGPLSLRSVMCPKFAKQIYTVVRDKISAGKKTDALTM